MTKKEKRISVNSFDKVAQERAQIIQQLNWNGLEITVRRVLSLQEMLGFVNDVVESCFSATGAYQPEAFDIAVRSNLLTRYGNFTLPENLEHRYTLLWQTDAVDTVLGFVDEKQFQEILQSAKQKVAYRCQTNVSAVEQQISAAVKSLDELQQKVAALFAGVTADDVNALVGAMASSGGFSTESVVKAYMQQKAQLNEE